MQNICIVVVLMLCLILCYVLSDFNLSNTRGCRVTWRDPIEDVRYFYKNDIIE